MTGRSRRLLVLLALVCLTWSLLAQFVWRMADGAHGNRALPYGGIALAAYLTTIGYATYYRTYWAKPRVVTGREWPPMLRWVATIVVVGGVGLTAGVAFPEFMNTTLGQLVVQTLTFGIVGVGLVVTMAKRPTPTSEVAGLVAPSAAAAEPPTFGRSALSVGAWQVYGFVGAALLFAPIYLVMKGFETYVDIPACERTCEAHGFAYERLVTGKSTYNCHCTSKQGRRTFHDRAYIGGGKGASSAIADWFVRVTTVLGVLGGWLALLVGTVRLFGRRSPDGVAASLVRAVAGFTGKSDQAPAAPPTASPRKVKSRKRRGRG